MRVYISVDMEGVAGISHPAPTARDDSGYLQAAELMVGETNAAVEGATAGGATEVVVNDSHGSMFNLRPTEIDAASQLLQGQKSWSMVEGANGKHFDVALFIGYHAWAGHPTGNLSHTFSKLITKSTMNGQPAGEAAFNAMVLGAWGIPVGMITGDDTVADEMELWFPWAEAVAVKSAVSRNSSLSVHPSQARARVRDAAERTVRRVKEDAGALKPLVIRPVRWEAQFASAAQADFAASFPGPTRTSGLGVEYESNDPVDAYRALIAATRLASIVVVG